MKDGTLVHVRRKEDGQVYLALYRKDWEVECFAYFGSGWSDRPDQVEVVRELKVMPA